MGVTWGSSLLGHLFTSTVVWSITLREGQFFLKLGDKCHVGSIFILERLSFTPGAIWSRIDIAGANGRRLTLDGISNSAARQLVKAI